MALPQASDLGPAPAAPRILVVDDDPARRAHPARRARRCTATRARARTRARRALEMLAASRLDLVLLDVRLPGINGFETCARIREPHGPSLPVLMLTAFGDPDVACARATTPAPTTSCRSRSTPPARAQGAGLPAPQVAPRRERAQPRGGPGPRPRPGPAARDRPRLVADRRARGVPPDGDGAPGQPHRRADLPDRALRPGHPHPGGGAARPRPLRRSRADGSATSSGPSTAASGTSAPGGPTSATTRAPTRASLPEMVQAVGAESVVLVPDDLGGRGARPPGRRQQAGRLHGAPTPSCSRSSRAPRPPSCAAARSSTRQRRHAARLERLATLVGDMAAAGSRAALICSPSTVRAARPRLRPRGLPRRRTETPNSCALRGRAPASGRRTCPWTRPAPLGAARCRRPFKARHREGFASSPYPSAPASQALGVLEVVRCRRPSPFAEEEMNLLSALAGQLAVALQKSGAHRGDRAPGAPDGHALRPRPRDDGAARPAAALRQGDARRRAG